MMSVHIEFEDWFKFLIDAAIYQKLGSIDNLEISTVILCFHVLKWFFK